MRTFFSLSVVWMLAGCASDEDTGVTALDDAHVSAKSTTESTGLGNGASCSTNTDCRSRVCCEGTCTTYRACAGGGGGGGGGATLSCSTYLGVERCFYTN